MSVTVTKNSGFCFGVKKAIEQTEQLINKNIDVFCLGDIIHNDDVINKLKNKGVKFIKNISDAPKNCNLIIRAHGEPPITYKTCKEKNIVIYDYTCPYVKKIHNLVKEKHSEQFEIVIFGRKEHPEVIGINGYCDTKAIIISNEQDANLHIKSTKKAYLFSQTTMNKKVYEKIYKILKNKYKSIEKSDTICNATGIRQDEAVELAKKVDLMIIIGGQKSSNTKKLYELCKVVCNKTYFIERIGDMPPRYISKEINVGITAGASTPDWIVEEVKEVMEEKEKQGEVFDFEKELEKSLVVVRSGQVVTGKVISVNLKEVFVDIGYKSDGTIPADEFELSEDGMPKIKVGDEVDSLIKSVRDSEGVVYLSKKRVDDRKKYDKINEASASGETVKVEVKEAVKGGLIVNVFGTEGFIPASQISDRFIRNLNKYVGRTIKARIIENDRRRRKLILSSRILIEEEKARIEKEVWGKIEIGKKIIGKVKSFTNFGAFVDVGGIDGLIHITELSWGKVGHPSDILTKGAEIEVVIKDFNREENKISLGYKKEEDNPWFNAEDKYETGRVFTGKIVRILPFGAFVNIDDGIDVLVHISQISTRRITSPSQVLSEGMDVDVAIIDVDIEKRKINASIKAVKPYDPEIDEEAEKRLEEKRKQRRTKKFAPKPSRGHKEEMSNTIGDILAGLTVNEEGNATEEE